MNREMIKSICLALLVLASLMMTWNILFYRGDYEKSPSGTVRPVAIAESRVIDEVVRPTLAVHNHGDDHFGVRDYGLVSKAYQLLQEATFSDVVPLYGDHDVPARSGDDTYELLFPSPLTQDTLRRIFTFGENEPPVSGKVMVDRVEIYISAEHRIVAVFREPDGSARFYAAVNQLNLDTLADTMPDSAASRFGVFDLKSGQVYLPLEKTKLSGRINYYEELQIEDFIPMLFSNPDNVVKTGEGYSDATSQLKDNGGILQFVNSAVDTDEGQTEEDPIQRGFQEVNQSKAWTDDFIYDHLNTASGYQEETVEFRMRLGNYMVYNTEYYPNPYLTTIELKWKSGELSTMNRTLINLNPIDEQGEFVLDSGDEVLKKLEDTHIAAKDIQGLAIGYHLDHPQEERGYSLIATPDWFYRQNDRWHSVTEAVMPREKNEMGKQT